MTTTRDVIVQGLRAASYTGAYQDMLYAYLKEKTGLTEGALNDLLKAAYSVGTVNEALTALLADSSDGFSLVDPDPYFANVVLLMHMDGVDGGTTFTDVKGKIVTGIGNAQTTTNQLKFGTASAKFDGVGDMLLLPVDISLNLPGDWTIELFARKAVNWTGTEVFLSGQYPDVNFQFYTNNGTLNLYNNTATISSLATFSGLANTWYHIAACRSGNILRFFVDGVQLGVDLPLSVTMEFSRGGIGAFRSVDSTLGGDFNGFIDELRITKGVARYTTNFTPPIIPFPES